MKSELFQELKDEKWIFFDPKYSGIEIGAKVVLPGASFVGTEWF
jgi:hypothetical protein